MSKLEGRGFSWAPILRNLDRGVPIDPVTGLGGTTLKVNIGEINTGEPLYQVSIRDASKPETYYLVATVGVKDRDLRMDLRTKDPLDSTKRHPALFASQFVKDAVTLFDERWGIRPTHFIGVWSHNFGVDNLTQFNESYRIWGIKVLAARSTWTSGVMRQVGFDDIREHDVHITTPYYQGEPREVEATFWRERPKGKQIFYRRVSEW